MSAAHIEVHNFVGHSVQTVDLLFVFLPALLVGLQLFVLVLPFLRKLQLFRLQCLAVLLCRVAFCLEQELEAQHELLDQLVERQLVSVAEVLNEVVVLL